MSLRRARRPWAVTGLLTSLLGLGSAEATTTFTPSSCSNLTTCDVAKSGGALDLTVWNTGTASGTSNGLEGTVNQLSGTGFTYGHTYNSAQTTAFNTSNGVSYGFYDDYVFTVGDNQLDSVTSSISLYIPGTNIPALGIDNLQARLYSLTDQGIAPLITTPVGPTVAQGWSSITTFSGGTLTASVIGSQSSLGKPVVIGAGTYVLEIRGTANGTFGGGSYSGVLNLTPVPLPGALWSLLGGLGLLGLVARRRPG